MASFGEKLRHEREMRGITLREIADATKISARFLRALEEDRLDVLPGGIFPRAFARQYATFLGLDAALLLEQFGAANGEAVVERRPPPPPERRRPRISAGQLILGGIDVVRLNMAHASHEWIRASIRRPRRTTSIAWT